MIHNYHGFNKNHEPRRVALVVALALILVCAVGGTLAYLVAKTEPITNIFTASSVDTDLEETVENGVKSSVKVKNTGSIPAYIRVAVVANTVDENGDIIGSADVSSYLGTANWTKGTDGYYYYNSEVQPDSTTEELLKESIELENIQVTILASAIQSVPASAVQEAWGMTYSDGSWSRIGN